MRRMKFEASKRKDHIDLRNGIRDVKDHVNMGMNYDKKIFQCPRKGDLVSFFHERELLSLSEDFIATFFNSKIE